MESIYVRVMTLASYEREPLPLTTRCHAGHVRWLKHLLGVVAPRLDEHIIERFNQWFVSPFGLRSSQHLLMPFVNRVHPYAEELGVTSDHCHSKETLTSGWQSFWGGLVFDACQKKLRFEDWFVKRKGSDDPKHFVLPMDCAHIIFDYVLLYIYVDHYLDSKYVDKDERQATLKTLFHLLHNPYDTKIPKSMIGLVFAYRRLLELRPEARSSLVLLFETEVVGLKYQAGGFDRIDYLRICELKGGRTALAINALLGYPVDEGVYNMGACIQLVDDLIDANADTEAGIATIATHDLKTLGCLDALFIYTMRRIFELPERFDPIKIIFLHTLLHAVMRDPNYTRILKTQTKPHTYLRSISNINLYALIESWLAHHILKTE